MFFALRASTGSIISVSEGRAIRHIRYRYVLEKANYGICKERGVMFYVQKVTGFVIFCTQNIINAKNVKQGLFLFKPEDMSSFLLCPFL